MSTIIEQVQPIIEPIVEEHECELVDLEYVKEGPNWYLRIYADNEAGISLEECAKISEDVSDALDNMEKDIFPKAYFLEVSSPGAERPLKNEEAIVGAIGSYVHFDYYVPQYGEKFHEGTLVDVTDDFYILDVMIKTRQKQLEIEKKSVSNARLAIKF
ncbi:ribosome maturation factor RimP [Aerococcaceae bacterium DSM 111022]|nr:ribosome maturation factor RimP [Aerococcaceae bacterium DSM 111022]